MNNAAAKLCVCEKVAGSVALQLLVPFARTTLQNPVLTQRELRCLERLTPGQGRIACFVGILLVGGIQHGA